LKKPNRRKRERSRTKEKGESLNWRTNSGCARRSFRRARPASCSHVMAVMRLGRRGSSWWSGSTADDFGCCRLGGRRLSLAAWSSVPLKCSGFVLSVGCWWRRWRDAGFEDCIVSGRQCVSVISIRSAVEGWIDGTDVRAFAYPPTLPIGVAVEDFEVHLAETMASVGAVLHNGGLIVPIV